MQATKWKIFWFKSFKLSIEDFIDEINCKVVGRKGKTPFWDFLVYHIFDERNKND